MASFVLSTTETSGYTLSEGEYAFITATGVIAVTGSALNSGGVQNNIDVVNEGSLFGEDFGISFGGQGIYVSNSGSIRGGSVAVFLTGSGDRTISDVIYNTGVIEGMSPTADGIISYMGGVNITNSGVISTSGDDAIQMSSNQTNGIRTNEIFNSGIIITTGDGYAINMTNTDTDIIRNTGEISGGIVLGGGDDQFLGENGIVDGEISGGAGDDIIWSGIGNDLLNGGTGRDKLHGGAGNDTATYEDSSAGVRVNLTSNRGRGGDARGDWLFDIENLIGSDYDDTLIGDAISNILEGGDGADTLNGEGGNDFLFGGSGDDTLIGGDGDDILNGGLDRDILWGGEGADIFEFLDVEESGIGSSRDVIKDFEQGVDLIDLAAMGATSFSAGGFTSTAGEVTFKLIGGGTKTVIEYDHDGDGAADFQILMTNGGFTMTSDDFVLG